MCYSAQIVAAAYVITAMTKLQVSGLAWITDAPNFVIRIIRFYSGRAIDLNNMALMEKGRLHAEFFLLHSLLLKAGFACALSVELGAVIAMYSKRSAKLYSVLLLLLHGGIFVLFGGVLINFFVLTLVYLSNLPSFFMSKTSNSVHHPPTSIVSLISSFTLPFVFIAFTYIIRDQHPFSTYAMFASSSDNTDYFFISDRNGVTVSPSTFRMHTTEIKSMIVSAGMKSHQDVENDSTLKIIAPDVLKDIISMHSKNAPVITGALKLYRHKIWITNGVISEANVLLATTPSSP
jgi:hypothetical protein